MQGQLNVWDNIANYKKCRKKSYEIHVCMPPKNTIVINKLEQYDTYVALGKKDHFTADEVAKMKVSNPQMLATLQNLVSQGKAYAVTQNTPFVLAGTIGEMWCISPDKLAQTYMFLQGGQPVAINQQSLQSRMKNGLMDWTLIRTSQQAQQGMNMACFVPTAKKGQIKTSWGSLLNINGAGVPHGKGDFVLCDMMPNGQPNLANRWVVNGEVFANTYDNHGWTDYLVASSIHSSLNISQLPKLVSGQSESIDPVSLTEYSNLLLQLDCFNHNYNSLLIPCRTESYYSNNKTAYRNDIIKNFCSLQDNILSRDNKVNIHNLINKVFSTKAHLDNPDLVESIFVRLGNSFLRYYLTIDMFGHGAKSNRDCSKTFRDYMFKAFEINALSEDYCCILAEKTGVVVSDTVISVIYNLRYCRPITLDFSKNGFGCRLDEYYSKPIKSIQNGVSWDKVHGVGFDALVSMGNLLFTENLYKELASSFKITSPISALVHYFNSTFSCLGGDINSEDLHKLNYNKSLSGGRFRLKIYKDGNQENNNPSNTCIIFIRLQNVNEVHVSAKMDNNSFDKVYKLGISSNIIVVTGLVFINFCRWFKLNPARTLYGNKKSINIMVQIANSYLKEQGKNCYISVKEVNYSTSNVNIRFDIKREMDNSIIATRTFVISSNYKLFDYTKTTGASHRLLSSIRNSDSTILDLRDIIVVTYISRMADSKQSDSEYELSEGLERVGTNWGILVSKLDTQKRFSIPYKDIVSRLNSTLDIKFSIDDADYEDSQSVWFIPTKVPKSLFKDFYLGIMATENSVWICFRHVLEEDYDFDIEVSKSVDKIITCISSIINQLKREYEEGIKFIDRFLASYTPHTRHSVERGESSIHDGDGLEDYFSELTGSMISKLGVQVSDYPGINLYISVNKLPSMCTKPDHFFKYEVDISNDDIYNTAIGIGCSTTVSGFITEEVIHNFNTLVQTIANSKS